MPDQGDLTSEVAGAPDALARIAEDRIVVVRGVPVILADDLAAFYGTTTKAVNQYRKRNEARFTEDYAFQLTKEEWEILRSQNVTSNRVHGGNRYLPWAYTEHGVAMMSMGMKGRDAVELSKVIIDTFVHHRRGTLPNARVVTGDNAQARRRSLQEKIYNRIEELLDSEAPIGRGKTFRQELGSIAEQTVEHIEAILARPKKNNEKISAEISKLLAEAEKIYAEARKTHLEADSVALDNNSKRLGFIRELRDMALQLERDDWLDVFETVFGEAEQKLALPEA